MSLYRNTLRFEADSELGPFEIEVSFDADNMHLESLLLDGEDVSSDQHLVDWAYAKAEEELVANPPDWNDGEWYREEEV